MMQTMKVELQSHLKPKVKTSVKKKVKHNQIFFVNNLQHSNLTWEDVAGLF